MKLTINYRSDHRWLVQNLLTRHANLNACTIDGRRVFYITIEKTNRKKRNKEKKKQLNPGSVYACAVFTMFHGFAMIHKVTGWIRENELRV